MRYLFAIISLMIFPGIIHAKLSQDPINIIRKNYQEANTNLKTYNLMKKTLLGESSEGAELNGYYHHNTLRMIKVTYYAEMGRSTVEYYFTKHELIFVYKVDITYNKPFGKINQKKETRIYLWNNKLIRYIDSDNKIKKLTQAQTMKILNETRNNVELLEDALLYPAMCLQRVFDDPKHPYDHCH